MPYYMGDFYMGDYGGDPFFGALIGGIGKLARGIGGRIFGRAPRAVPRIGFPGGGMAPMETAIEVARGGIRRVGGAIARHPVLTAAGAAGTVGILAGREIAPGVPQKGFHISKRTGRLVRNRRMRVTNPKALRRAIRRASGFSRLAMRVLRFTHPRRARGRPYFRRRTHKRV